MYQIFWIHSFGEGHLGSFQLLAITNKAAVNIVEHVSLLHVGASSGYILRSGIAGTSISIISNLGLISDLKELKKLDSRESNNPIKKWGYRAKQRILNWGILNGSESSKEMFNILSHQGNANQNNPDIPPHTS